MPPVRTKLFEEHRVLRRSGDNVWTVEQQSVPVDEAVSAWVRDTGARVVAVTAPGIHSYWLDPQATARAFMVAVLVTYQEPARVDPDPPTADQSGGPGAPPAAPPPAPPGDPGGAI